MDGKETGINLTSMQSNKFERLDLASIRARLASEDGPRFWQSLEALAGTDGFRDFLHREFPRQASEWVDDEPGRRKFLKLAGASLALAGLSACTKQPPEKIMPYVRQPEDLVPGKPLFYATAVPMNGVGAGVLVESHMGRPTKVEGNPDHPASRGAADLFTQASILNMYDPDRSVTVLKFGEISTWSAFTLAFKPVVDDLKAKQGAGLRILTETTTSPVVASQMEEFLRLYPQAKWFQYDPAGSHNTRAGSTLAFGEPVNTFYRVDQADVILTLDSDFLMSGPGSVRYMRDFSGRRRARQGTMEMSRLYSVESTPTVTGSKADHRWPMRASEVGAFAVTLAKQLGVDAGSLPAGTAPEWLQHVVADLKAHSGRCLIVAGETQPPAVHALVHAMNQALGNVGKTVVNTNPVEVRPSDQIAGLKELVGEMQAGRVEVLILNNVNPVFNAPSDVPFEAAMDKVGLRIHLGQFVDETGERCHWHIPEAHYFETWGDIRSYDGTVTIQQPLISPLYDGKSLLELMALFGDQPERSTYDIVRAYWQQTRGSEPNFDFWWRKSVHDGVVPGTAAAEKAVTVRAGWAASASLPAASEGLEVNIRPDPTVYDGSFANNGWLQELPKPMLLCTWDNTVLMSVRTAERLGVQSQDTVNLQVNGKSIQNAPVLLWPGHADNSVTLHLGYGRRKAGRVGTGIGFDVYPLRTSASLWSSSGQVTKAGGTYPLSITSEHWSMEGRHLVRQGTLEQFKESPNEPHFVHVVHEPPKDLTLYSPYQYTGYAWGMSIDLNACTGCNACIVACQSENNISVVGKEQVGKGREMHWIRVDRYYEGDLENPRMHHQPVPCQQCEHAPCEVVCPVAATTHSDEGLNDMVYNRCVGTRYCSNNCPYKVRRFNFLLFSDWYTESLKLQRNPDVSVRSRGVMEKCTYCVQRINLARIAAKREDRKVKDGEILTACQQTCPAQAISFGDLNDPNSQVAKLKAEPLNYGLLTDLNTRPRTTYLASLRNPNPAIEPPGEHHQANSEPRELAVPGV